jgi:hypothetical protein
MEYCNFCLRSLADDVLTQSINEATVCRACAERITACERAAMLELIVAAFAQFLHERAEVPSTEPCSKDAARRFWAALVTSGDAVEAVGVVAALEALAIHAPSHVFPVTD